MFKRTNDTKWKWMALTQKESLVIQIPKRQFIGESKTLLENLDKRLTKLIIKRFNEI